MPISASAEERLRAAIVVSNRAMVHMLAAIREMDIAEAYRVDGAVSMIDWLCWAHGVGGRQAAEWVRLAKGLEALPAIAAAFEDGDLSYEKIVCLCRYATPSEDVLLAREAVGWTARDCRLWAAVRRREATARAGARYARRSLRIYPDTEQGWTRFSGRLPDDAGLTFQAAIESRAASYPKNPQTGQYDAWEQRQVDALVEICHLALAEEDGSEETEPCEAEAAEAAPRRQRDRAPARASVVAYVQAETLVQGGDGAVATLSAGMPVCGDTFSRLLCDSRLQAAVVGEADRVVGFSPNARTAPPSLRRRLVDRDRGCAFPGCTSRGPYFVHHIVHHADGGPTDEWNCTLLCYFHHHLVHEGGWSSRRMGSGKMVFIRPDGRPVWVRTTATADPDPP